MTLIVSIIAENVSTKKEFQNKLPNLSPLQEGNVHYKITSRPGRTGLAGILKRKLMRNVNIVQKLQKALQFRRTMSILREVQFDNIILYFL